MKAFLYAVCDVLSGFVLGVDLTTDSPEIYVAKQNQINCAQPSPLAASLQYKLVGELDNETLDGRMYEIKTTVGDLSASIKKLEEWRNAHPRTTQNGQNA